MILMSGLSTNVIEIKPLLTVPLSLLGLLYVLVAMALMKASAS
jgi:hypothetical protein